MNCFKKISLTTSALAALVFSLQAAPGSSHSLKPNGKVYEILEKEGTHLSKLEKMDIMKNVLHLSQEYQMDPFLILSIIHVESRFKPKAQSNRGALGLMQVKPIVVREVANQLGINAHDHPKLLSDKSFNLRVGVHYFAFLMKKFRGDTHKALMAYNRGPTAVSLQYGNRPVPTNGYQGKVFKVYRQYVQSL